MKTHNKFLDAAKHVTKSEETEQVSTEDIEILDKKSYPECSKEELIEEIMNWQHHYNGICVVNNRHVDIINQLIFFITMQCGILYTAITGDVQVENPLKDISPILIPTFDSSQEDLHFFRQGLIIYLKKLGENGEIEAAYQEWLKYINAEEE